MKSIDMSVLGNELRTYLELLEEKPKLAKQVTEFPPEPKKPAVVESATDWQIYQGELQNRENRGRALDKAVEDLKKKIEKQEQAIRSLVPANTWIKVPLGYGKGTRYVGYQTDSWPGYVPPLLIETELPTRVLAHHVTRD